MSESNSIAKRIRTFKGSCGYHGINQKLVCEKANLNYDSVITNMEATLQGVKGISDSRMSILETNLKQLIKAQSSEKVPA